MTVKNTFALIVLCLLFSCTGKETITYDPELFQQKLMMPFNIPKANPSVSLKFVREEVRKLIKERQESIRGDISDLTYHHMLPQYLSNLGRVDSSVKYTGYWLKFENNNTFSYGIYDKVLSTGIFHYAPTSEILIMLDDDENVEPKMWSYKYNSEFANILGHPFIIKQKDGVPYIILSNWADTPYLDTLGKSLAEVHNGMQLKMILMDERPSR